MNDDRSAKPDETKAAQDADKAKPASEPAQVGASTAGAAVPAVDQGKEAASAGKPAEKSPAEPDKPASPADKPPADPPADSPAKPAVSPNSMDTVRRLVLPSAPTETLKSQSAGASSAPAPSEPAPSGPLGGHQLDRRATFRRWLEAKTKDELIELIMTMEKEQPGLDVTEKMMKVKLSGPLQAPVDSFKIPDDLPYLRLPVVRTIPANEPTPTWRIVLISLEQNNKPVGLIVDAEITIGRTAGGSTPDLDLTPFGAALKGVSRVHARLRPTMHSLTLMDNNSSNGTYCNRSRIPADSEQPLKEGDVIAFGQAYFLLRVIKSPDAGEARTII